MIHLNCDMGEGMPHDHLVMPYIDAANISCGLHAGDETTIRSTIESAIAHRVQIGAHPSFDDRARFGRVEMNLTDPELYDLVVRQLISFSKLVSEYGQQLTHVKPHGALYNLSAKNPRTASVIAQAVFDLDPGVCLYGLSGSASISEARRLGLLTKSETFADRRYAPDGSLVPRDRPGAVITHVEEIVEQCLFLREGKARAADGTFINLESETICIHGDGANAVLFARAIHERFRIS